MLALSLSAVTCCMLPALPVTMLVLVLVLGVGVQLWNLSSFTRFFIAIYNIIFASLLILHESQVGAI